MRPGPDTSDPTPAAGESALDGARDARELADLSVRLLACLESGDDEEALRLVQERGRLIDALMADPAAPEKEGLLIRQAHDLGRLALDRARAKSAEIRASLESLEQGRSGLSAYHPRPPVEGDTLDVCR